MGATLRLVVDRLGQSYGDHTVFAALTFTVEAGTALLVTGTNGSGKSTLLRTIAGLSPPVTGTVRLEGGPSDVPLAEQCHLVSTLNAIKLDQTARQNLMHWSGVLATSSSPTPTATRVAAALDRLGLTPFADMPAAVLSTGWRRRLGLARVMVAPRPLWLLDEPTAALDLAASRVVVDLVRGHLAGGGLAVIATHLDLDLAGARILDLPLAAVQ